MKGSLLLSLCAALSACVGAPVNDPPPTSQGNPVMAASSTASSMSNAEEVGERFLKLIEGLRSRNDITVERIQRTMGVRLERMGGTPKENANVPKQDDGFFYFQNLDGDWFYVISMVLAKPGRDVGVSLEFINRMNRSADMSFVCGLSFARYQAALKKMGYQENMLRDGSGQVVHIIYRKGDLLIGLIPQLKISPRDGKTYPACVRRIGL
ncbi:MAG: hypothetical protein LBP86_12315 [Azoarcus sp.]|nr:hypothetical protein [Azoarcus sp.]